MAITPMPGVGGTMFGGGGGAGGMPSPQMPGGVAGPAGGKSNTIQNLASPHSGLRSTITPGDSSSRMMGQYGKGHSFGALPGMGGASKAPSGLGQLRGGGGAMKRNVRMGGLGPGKMSTPGTAQDYSMSSPDAS
ncbi:MAG TPA: hypothetical protein VGF35_05095 [Steroidobacteraceae bacterium]|jgi:hypothetical protein